MNQKKLTFLSFSLLIVLSLIIPSLVNGQISSTASNKTIEISPSEIVETKTCPVGCTCFGDNVVCPVEPPCKSPCIKKGNTCTCREESPKTCPIGCTCSGNATTCPTSELKPIEAKISTESGAKTIFIEKITNGISLKSEKATAITTGNLIIEQGALSFKTSVGNKEIKVLPEEASSKVTNTTKVGAIELKEESQQPIYAVKGKTRAKLLFVIPISMPTETKVNAESGRIISVSKPWWSFLAR